VDLILTANCIPLPTPNIMPVYTEAIALSNLVKYWVVLKPGTLRTEQLFFVAETKVGPISVYM